MVLLVAAMGVNASASVTVADDMVCVTVPKIDV